MKFFLTAIACLLFFNSYSQTTEEYFKMGSDFFDAGDYYSAINAYTKCIEVTEGIYPPALTNRALCKAKIGDVPSAFEDINLVINIIPNWSNPYYWRGYLNVMYSKDYYGAISDFNKSIDLGSSKNDSYYYIGLAKSEIGDTKGACIECKKACDLGVEVGCEWYYKNCR